MDCVLPFSLRNKRFFPEYFLDYREILDPSIRWTDRIQSSSGDWTGNLFDFFFRVYNKLTRDFEKPFALDGVTRIEDTPVHKAVREALANCIVNTDFYLPRGIVILKEADKIVNKNEKLKYNLYEVNDHAIRSKSPLFSNF